MARDYTDGHGWAKLDATSAHRLAETMCALRGRTADKRRDMLLWCFSRLSDGDPPTFRVGARTLAKACGVTRRAAMMFLSHMDEEGWFVVTKEADEGLTHERTFWWFAEGGTEQRTGTELRTTPVRKPRPQRTGGWYAEPDPNVPHQMTESSERDDDYVITPPPPFPAPADAGPEGAGTDWWPRDPIPVPPPPDAWGGEP